MRTLILTATAVLLWPFMPTATTAEEPFLQAVRVCVDLPGPPEHRRANFSKKPVTPPRAQRCWYEDPSQVGANVPGSIAISPGADVDFATWYRNSFRARHSKFLWRTRAFPGSDRRVHGFNGRRGHRGHGRRW